MASTSGNPYQSPEACGQPPRPAGRWVGCLLKLFGLALVIGLLIALLLPATRSAPEAARRAQCINNLKQIAIAFGITN